MFEGITEKTVPTEFLNDVVAFCSMFYQGGVACAVHGEEHQEMMLKKWPHHWMDMVFEGIGRFGTA